MEPLRAFKAWTACCATMLLISADDPKTASEQDDRRALQGTWILETAERFGIETPQDATLDEVGLRAQYLGRLPEERELQPNPKKYRTTLTIKGNSFVFRIRGDVAAKGELKLHVDRKPKVIERRTTMIESHFHEHSSSVFLDEETYYSSYSLEGDTLKWCSRSAYDAKGLRVPGKLKDVPSTFATDKDGEITLVTYKREK